MWLESEWLNGFIDSISSNSRKLDWVEDEVGEKTKRLQKVVILKYMFTLQELEVCCEPMTP